MDEIDCGTNRETIANMCRRFRRSMYDTSNLVDWQQWHRERNWILTGSKDRSFSWPIFGSLVVQEPGYLALVLTAVGILGVFLRFAAQLCKDIPSLRFLWEFFRPALEFDASGGEAIATILTALLMGALVILLLSLPVMHTGRELCRRHCKLSGPSRFCKWEDLEHYNKIWLQVSGACSGFLLGYALMAIVGVLRTNVFGAASMTFLGAFHFWLLLPTGTLKRLLELKFVPLRGLLAGLLSVLLVALLGSLGNYQVIPEVVTADLLSKALSLYKDLFLLLPLTLMYDVLGCVQQFRTNREMAQRIPLIRRIDTFSDKHPSALGEDSSQAGGKILPRRTYSDWFKGDMRWAIIEICIPLVAIFIFYCVGSVIPYPAV